MRIAVYGGSFNPPHVAHAMVASWLLWTGKVDEVWLVPVFQHAFTGIHNKKLAPYSLRIELCEKFGQDVDRRVKVSDVEAHLPVPSYTIDTLRYFQQTYPQHIFRLVVGADVIPDIPKWKDWSAIEEHFSPLIVGRVGYPCPQGAVEFPGVSSTEIRQLIGEGRPPEHLLTCSVAQLLERSNPYA